MMLSREQKQILRAQIDRTEAAQKAAQQEINLLQRMLVLLDPRFSDPANGLALDPESMELIEASPVDTGGSSNAEETIDGVSGQPETADSGQAE